jgi:hypothetical protein
VEDWTLSLEPARAIVTTEAPARHVFLSEGNARKTSNPSLEVTVRMDKCEFFKKPGRIMTGPILAAFPRANGKSAPRENWPGNITYCTNRVFTPVSIDDGYRYYEAMRQTPGLRFTPLHRSWLPVSNVWQLSRAISVAQT